MPDLRKKKRKPYISVCGKESTPVNLAGQLKRIPDPGPRIPDSGYFPCSSLWWV